jgi:hypothetical protein
MNKQNTHLLDRIPPYATEGEPFCATEHLSSEQQK